MATTYTLIDSEVLSSSAASVTFSSIPATYTDLVVRLSARDDNSDYNWEALLSFNSQTTNFSSTFVQGSGSSTNSGSMARYYGRSDSANATANTFSNGEIYIPNYAGTTNKPYSSFNVSEINSATGNMVEAVAGLRSNTAAITSLTLSPYSGNFVSGSSFYLYGISNA